MEPVFSFELLLIIVVICILILGGYYLYYFMKRREEKKHDNSYLLGLKYMVEGENRRAVEMFKESVRQNSENIDAYIKLGIILRNEGLIKNAIRIHKDLLIRGKLPEEFRDEVYFNLGIDYYLAGNLDKAANHFENIKGVKKYQSSVIAYLLDIYEKKQLWEKAIGFIKSSDYAKSEKGKKKLAFYKVKQGVTLAKSGEEKEARVLFKEAVKIDIACAEAYLLLGDSYVRENRTSDAINVWTDFCHKVSEKAHLAFQRMEKAWYEKGHFSKIEELYNSILSDNDKNIHAIIALSEIYRKMGDYKDALKILEDAQKKELDPELIKAQIVKVLFDKGQFKESANNAIEIINKLANGKTGFSEN